MKLKVVCDSVRRPIAGVGRVTLTLVRELARLGQEITPIDLFANQEVERFGNTTLVVEPRLPWGQTALWHLELLRRLPCGDEDFLLDPTGYPDVLGRHPNLIFWVHDLHMLEKGFYRPGKRLWFRTFLRRGLERSRLVVCVSNHTRHQVLGHYDLPEEKCVVVPNALDKTMGAECAEPADPFDGVPYYLTVGSIGGRKNTLRLLDAFAAARCRGLDTHLILAGTPGQGWSAVKRRMNGDVKSWVHVFPGVDDATLRKLYRGARGLLFPSLEEGFGLPILEAFASGIPVLTSNYSAMREVAGDAALLVDPTLTDAIAAGWMTLETDGNLRADLIAMGNERLSLFTAEKQARTLIGHLNSLRGKPQ
jgi:glycosyltransferase involved in cell wall biosynthesis